MQTYFVAGGLHSQFPAKLGQNDVFSQHLNIGGLRHHHHQYTGFLRYRERSGACNCRRNRPILAFQAPTLPLSRTYKHVKPFLEKETSTIIKGWLCTVVSVGSLYLAVPRIGKISSLFSGGGEFGNLIWFSAPTMVLLLTRAVSHYFQQALLWEVSSNAAFGIRSYVYNEVLNRDMSYFESAGGNFTGDIAYRLTAEAKDTADTVYTLLQTIIPKALQLVAMGFRMFSLSPALTVTIMLIFPCISLAITNLGEKLRHISRMAEESIAALSSYLNEVLPSMLMAKVYNAEGCELQRFNYLANVDRQRYSSKKKMKALIPEVIIVIYAGTSIALITVASLFKMLGMADGSGLASFVTSLVLCIKPIQDLGRAYNELKQGEPAIERLFELVAPCSVELKNEGLISLTNVSGEVKFCNVSFQYDKTLPLALRNLSWHVKSGDTVAIVGPSGSGKTTVAKLLLRLYEPTMGCILIDGHDIRNIDLKSLRKHITLVPQDVALFSGTVAENIAYGVLPDLIDMKRVENAAKLVNADSFIQMLPHGYWTEIGQRGSTLSGGQRQRVAIARALYKDASILVLDEATSSLDNSSESLVREALEQLTANRTVFVIAHRLETIRKADWIFVIDGGQLIEEGTHFSLLRKGGFYAKLYAMQELKQESNV